MLNKLTSLAFVALSFVGTAQAMTTMDHAGMGTALSRADVVAEYLRARAAGELDHEGFPTATAAKHTASTLTRANVTAEYLRARAAGEISIGFERALPVKAPVSTKTRAEVQMEYERARKAGELDTSFGRG